MKQGIFYGVGIGPRDPELLTIKAAKIIDHCPVLAVPKPKDGNTVALDIASGACDLSGKELLYLSFLMTRDEQKLHESHLAAAGEIIRKLNEGKDVAMLNLGDVSVYSTFSYVMEIISARGYSCEIIPGITSFCAVAAALKTSLTERDKPLHIIPAGYADLGGALELPGTRVLMKAGKSFPAVQQALDEKGLLKHAAMVQNCCMENETVYPSLEDVDIGETGYFTTVIVKE